MKNPITITVEVADHEDVADAIVSVAAAQILSSVAGVDDTGQAYYRESTIAVALHRKIDAAIDGWVRENVERQVIEILDEGVPRTDTYGQRVGREVVSVASLIHDKLRHELVERSQCAYSGNESVLSRVIREQVDHALSTDLAAEVAEAKGKIREAIKSEAAEVLTKAVAREVGVR